MSQEFVLTRGFYPDSIFCFSDCSRQLVRTFGNDQAVTSLKVTSLKQGGIRRRSPRNQGSSLFLFLASLTRAEADDRPSQFLCTLVSRSIRLCVTPRAYPSFSTYRTRVSQRLAPCASATHFIETAAHLLSSILNQVEIFREDHNSHRIATGKTILRIVTDYRCILFEFLLSSGEFDYA